MYEVEVELVDEGKAYSSCRTDEQIAASLLLKMEMLLGEQGNGGSGGGTLRLLSSQRVKRRK
jgi:hypothetical protein